MSHMWIWHVFLLTLPYVSNLEFFLNTSLTENVNDSFIEHVIFHWRKAKILVSKVDEAKNLKMVPLNRIRESDTLSIGLILSYSGTSGFMAT